MQLPIIGKDNQSKGKQTLPKQFDEPVREDLIKRAVLALQSKARQKYGAKPEAGKRPSVRISKRRHDYRGTYGIGQSRTYMLLLRKGHLGECSVTVWPDQLKKICSERKIHVLE